MRNAFAPILRARPCPIFGRPVRLRGRPHRLQPDTSPHALRIPDRSRHPALRDIPSSWLKVCLGCVRLSLSCPFRLLHTGQLSRPAALPRFRIRPSSSERRGDLTPMIMRCSAHRTTIPTTRNAGLELAVARRSLVSDPIFLIRAPTALFVTLVRHRSLHRPRPVRKPTRRLTD